jgi:hypothetical protein
MSNTFFITFISLYGLKPNFYFSFLNYFNPCLDTPPHHYLISDIIIARGFRCLPMSDGKSMYIALIIARVSARSYTNYLRMPFHDS